MALATCFVVGPAATQTAAEDALDAIGAVPLGEGHPHVPFLANVPLGAGEAAMAVEHPSVDAVTAASEQADWRLYSHTHLSATWVA